MPSRFIGYHTLLRHNTDIKIILKVILHKLFIQLNNCNYSPSSLYSSRQHKLKMKWVYGTYRGKSDNVDFQTNSPLWWRTKLLFLMLLPHAWIIIKFISTSTFATAHYTLHQSNVMLSNQNNFLELRVQFILSLIHIWRCRRRG